MDKDTIKFLLRQPLSAVFKRALTLLKNKTNRIFNIEINTSFVIPEDFNYPLINNSYIDIDSLDLSGLKKDVTMYHIHHYLAHRFDLLGSGWIEYSYKNQPLGVESVKFDIPGFCLEPKELLPGYLVPEKYLKDSNLIWALLDRDYQPIDWQRDYKSGYRWDSKKSSAVQRKDLPDGADLKMPWELSRLQFLPHWLLLLLQHLITGKKLF